jgi:HD-GYP domain-containing protein (c-di-GMP phosphodiesterase class II)
MVTVDSNTHIYDATLSHDDLMVELASETNMGRLLERILVASKNVTHADGGTIYLVNHTGKIPQLTFSLMVNTSLNIHKGGYSGEAIDLPPIPLYNDDGEPNYHNVASYAAVTKTMVCIDDVYDVDNFDFSGTRKFDAQFNYQSKSFLTVPLLSHDGDLVGVLQLLNAKDEQGNITVFNEEKISTLKALEGYAAITLNNLILVKDMKELLDSFIQCIAQAIDAKSSHTSAHCRRIPLLMELIAKAACEDQGTFKDFTLNEDEWYELKVASWLHDCGKLATPDTLLDKSTKLHLLQDGIETIKMRFAAAKLAIEKEYYEQLLYGIEDKEFLRTEFQSRIQELNDDLAFVIKANKGGEFMAEADKLRLNIIAQQRWLDSEGEEQVLIAAKELDFLCIERGTLSNDERNIINNHMAVTIDMLESLPFPRKLKRVPEYAGGHHEKMDGTGYPRGLKREEMSIPARMMGIADIFEALTSRDRPYKDPMKMSQVLGILQRMKEGNHIDPDLHDLFVNSRVWEEYARRELLPEQLDI